MSGKFINLRQARKQRDRTAKEKRAEANRAKFGRDKAEKAKQKADSEQIERTLDGAHLESDDD